MKRPCYSRSQHSQRGYVLLVLLLAVALLIIGVWAVLPKTSTELRREKEEELIHRGVQYERAIRNYHRKFGTYPTNIEQLEDTNHIRFLRKRYKDPMTGKDFRLLHVGEVQLPLTTPIAATNQSAPGENPVSAPVMVKDSTDQALTSGQNFGGGPLVGVASTSHEQSFHVFATKNHYRDWLFIYTPAFDTGGILTRPYDGMRSFAKQQAPNPALGGSQF